MSPRLPWAALVVAVPLFAATAEAQQRPRGRPARPPQDADPPADPSGPPGQPPRPPPRGEPVAVTPRDPLAVSPDIAARIGSDWDGRPPGPVDEAVSRKYFPYYEERRGDYRFRLVPPLLLEHTRGLPHPSQRQYGVPPSEDTEGLYGLLYYRRRSARRDADVVFPLAWHLRADQDRTTVIGPVVHREAPGEHDNWLAPLVFEGERKTGGYFHAPLLLTTSRWDDKGAFTLVGPYFRDRTGRDVDVGVAPFYFHGDNGDLDGARRTYTLIPPLLYYQRERQIDGSKLTVIGPVIQKSDPKRDVFDVAPFYFHIKGKPATGGIDEEHTTLFPFFHYGHTLDESLLVLPGFLRRKTKDVDTFITPFVSHSETRAGATSFTAAGPGVPLFFRYTDRDLGTNAFAVAPFVYHSVSPIGRDWLTPLFGRFETYGEYRTWWAFPTIQVTTHTTGWDVNVHPIVYVGRSGESSHRVLAPIFWDFASPKSRTTIGFPLFWRFADEDSTTQVALNTVYVRKRVPGGSDWQFHVVPLFSYGENPTGYWWNVLFGLAGYERAGEIARVKAFWVPIDVAGPPKR